MQRDIKQEVSRAISRLSQPQERLIRPLEREPILKRVFQLKSELGHLEALKRVMQEFRITERPEKEQEAYRRFLNIALTPDQKSRTKVTPKPLTTKSEPYGSDRPDFVRFQADLEKKFP